MRPTVVAAVVALVALAAASPTLGAGGTSRRCPIVVFTPNSGDGLFDIKARNISCSAARAKLRAARGEPDRLTGWTCRLVSRDELTRAGRYHCTNVLKVRGTTLVRLIAYTEGN